MHFSPPANPYDDISPTGEVKQRLTYGIRNDDAILGDST